MVISIFVVFQAREEEAIREVYKTKLLKEALVNSILDFSMPKIEGRQREVREAAAREGKTVDSHQARQVLEEEQFRKRLARVLIWSDTRGAWKHIASYLPFEYAEMLAEDKLEAKQVLDSENRLNELDAVQKLARALLGDVVVPLQSPSWRLRAIRTQLREVEEQVKEMSAHRAAGASAVGGEEKERGGQSQALDEKKKKLCSEIAAMKIETPSTIIPVSSSSSSMASSSSSPSSSSSSSSQSSASSLFGSKLFTFEFAKTNTFASGLGTTTSSTSKTLASPFAFITDGLRSPTP